MMDKIPLNVCTAPTSQEERVSSISASLVGAG